MAAADTQAGDNRVRRRRAPNKKKAPPPTDASSDLAVGEGSTTKTGAAMNNNSNGNNGRNKRTQNPKAANNANDNSGGGGGRKRNISNTNNGSRGSGGTSTSTAAAGGPSTSMVVDPKQKKQNRKMGKRAKQLESMEKKAKAEDEYFRKCQREAAANNGQNQQQLNGGKKQQQDRELALFGKQGAQGINFAKYDSISVDVKPGAIAQDSKKKKNTNNNNGGNTKNNGNNEVASIVFSDFNELELLPPAMMHNIKLMNYAKSTPIQRHAIPLGLAGHDLMCCAQTGSGKTCAFLLPVCASLANSNASQNDTHNSNKVISNGRNSTTTAEKEPVEPKCIVLAPTRELASQIELEAEKLCFNIPNLQPVAVYGGASQQKQLRELAFAGSNGGQVIIVATPGRLTDFVDRNLISLRSVRYLILDEADRMLDMGFEPQIRKLVLRSNMTSKEDGRQTAMFSATFPDKIQLLASEFLRGSYTWIAVGRVGSTTDSITQVILEATSDKRHKLKLVVKAVESGPKGRTLIFVQKKKTATWLKKQLSKGGPEGWDFSFDPIEAVEIHGDRSQSQREAALARFRSGECRILVATDVAARGLDIGGVEHVM